MRALALSNCILFCPVCRSYLGGSSLLKGERRRDGGELKAVEGGKTVVGMYYLREESIFKKI